MKTIRFLTIGLLFGSAFSIKAQKLKEADVPALVKQTQSTAFPKIKVDKWEKDGDLYEATFKSNNTETSNFYDAQGSLMATETEIPVSELPAQVEQYVKRALGGKKISEASKRLDATGILTYEAEIEKTDYIFDASGMFLRQEEKKEKK
jgi:hypothetical protein